MTGQLKELWALAFEDSAEAIDLFFDTAYAPKRCHTVLSQGRAVAALHWLDCEFDGQKLAYIYAVATHPDCRNQGLCRKLMTQTHDLLQNQGYAGAVLMPAKPGLRQMYAKLGYRECNTVWEFTCKAAGFRQVRAIDRAEYARLRRKYLPRGGLIQEGENLTYLETYARFYTGDDFLLAAFHEEQRLFGMELLGDRTAAPGILAAMGYPEGTFRTPGEGIPFAMCLPLKTEARMPSYLGLAFD